MKRTLLFYLAILFTQQIFSQTGYQVKVTIKPLKNQYIYLGYYYGKVKALADSALIDGNSTAVFSGKQKLTGGIYFIVSPKKEILFELLFDKQQNFTISADTANLPNSVVFAGSDDNSLFQSYSKNIAITGKEINDLMTGLSNASSGADSTRISEKLRVLNRQLLQSRTDIENKFPASMLATLFRSMKEPEIPPVEKHPGKKYDSLFAFQYYKTHYWDGIAFTDERLLRTPIFEPRLEKYYRELVAPDPDSIKKELDLMLVKSRSNNEMYRYLLTHFVQKYINPEYMGQDAVFVHLFEKYINNNPQIDWFTEKYKKYMSDRAYSLMANLIGQPASNIEMIDTSGKLKPLFEVQAPFTVICFWDPTCSHCKELVPKVDSIFQKKWKSAGVQVYGVMVDGGKEAWMQYIRENKLKDWIHVYQTEEQKNAVSASGRASYKQLYDVFQTPVLYLLDKDKRIIAKKLTYLQLDDVMNIKMKNTSGK
ncbi:MAG: thioredoxin-like domain-containing protein [Chitinophagaceae bacterium]